MWILSSHTSSSHAKPFSTLTDHYLNSRLKHFNSYRNNSHDRWKHFNIGSTQQFGAIERTTITKWTLSEQCTIKGQQLSHVHNHLYSTKNRRIKWQVLQKHWIGDQEVPKSNRFRYLGSIWQKNGELDGDLNHRIQAGWMKWKSVSGVLNDKIKNEDIRDKVGVAEIEGNMRENRLRWFGHVQRRPTDTPIRRCDYGTEVQGRRGRERPRKTLELTLRKDLEYLDLTDDMTQNRAQ
ncbi:unnamed protein product [Malus baccata var. baccata]